MQTEMIYETLKADLTADRVLLDQVLNYIRDQYGYTDGDLAKFFAEKYPQLEDYEVDLTFSPQYTPRVSDHLRYVTLLGKEALSPEDMSAMTKRLLDEGIECKYSTADGSSSALAKVHEVMIARFIKLLKLDYAMDPEIADAVEKNIANASQPLVNMLAREEPWHTPERKALLLSLLTLWKERNSYNGEKMSFLTSYLRTYRPDNLSDLQTQMQSLIKTCQEDMEGVDGRGFHDDFLKSMYDEDREIVSHQEDTEKGVQAHYQHLIDMSKLLLEDLEQVGRQRSEVTQ